VVSAATEAAESKHQKAKPREKDKPAEKTDDHSAKGGAATPEPTKH
jgi:hypothetical protein